MKYKVGDRVKVKNLDWYNTYKDRHGIVNVNGSPFIVVMKEYCGKVLTIAQVNKPLGSYSVAENIYIWTDDMFEGLADARDIPVEHPCDWLKRGLNLLDGYEFQDENGNVIKTSKITLVKKKPKYPATYKECCNIIEDIAIATNGYRSDLIYDFQKLLVCRDTYWKIVGEEMGLGKPWEPTHKDSVFSIGRIHGQIITECHLGECVTLEFPTEEMRDTFYENFKDLINECKELL